MVVFNTDMMLRNPYSPRGRDTFGALMNHRLLLRSIDGPKRYYSISRPQRTAFPHPDKAPAATPLMLQHAWEKPGFTAAVSEIWARIERFSFVVVSTRVGLPN